MMNALGSDVEAPQWGVKSLAKEINQSERATWHMVATGKLPVKKIGRRYCWYASAVHAALRADSGEAA